MELRNPPPARHIPRRLDLSNAGFVNAIVVCCVCAFLATRLSIRARVGSLVIPDLDVAGTRRNLLDRRRSSDRRTERLLFVSVLGIARVDVVGLVFVLAKRRSIGAAIGAPVVSKRGRRRGRRRVACQQFLVLAVLILCLLSHRPCFFHFFLLLLFLRGGQFLGLHVRSLAGADAAVVSLISLRLHVHVVSGKIAKLILVRCLQWAIVTVDVALSMDNIRATE
jgi:hypothetical protein